MITTVNLLELRQIINCEHGDPHNVLGMHVHDRENIKCVSVRAFIPQAAKITLIDVKDEAFTYELEKVHVDGFFETVIEDRGEWFEYKFKITGHEGNVWETFDPYSFEPTLGEMDLHLFGEGTHYQIFDKLGAHACVMRGVEGISFAVWAPNAKRVSVIGEFNCWDGRRGQMRVLSESGIWELFVPGLKKYDKYKFEVETQANVIHQKTDPYGNFAELRPSTNSLIYNINNYEWNDAEWVLKRNSTSPFNKPLNIYEVHLGSWKRVVEDGGRFMSYVELADDLISYVKEMGYTHIELLPVEEHPFDGSWGYQVTGYYAPTSRYGNPDEFMYFVDRCHQNGIGVILDWVPAHFPKDAHGLARFDGTALYEHQDPKQGEHPDWGTLIFNYGRKEVKNFLIANAIFWIEKYHIDGLRVDAVASMLYLDYGKKEGEWVPNEYGGRENNAAVEFIKHMNSVILGRYPNVLMIAEESTSWAGVSKPLDTGGLGFSMKWNMGWMNDFLSYMTKESIHRKHHHNNLTFGMVYAHTENFVLVLSHDEVVHGKGSLINKMPGDLWQKFANVRAALGYMFGHPGKKLLFMGGEFGQFSEWTETRSLDWHLIEYEHHRKLLNYVKDLNHLYLKENAFWHDDFGHEGFEWIDCNDASRSVLTFVRKGEAPGDTLAVICNFTPVVYNAYRFGAPAAGVYKEILNSDQTYYGGSGVINSEVIEAEAVPCHGRDYSLVINVPPFGVSILKLDI